MNQNSLTKGQKIGLKHFEDFELRIPREEIVLAEKLINKELKKIDQAYKITICGSYRFVVPIQNYIFKKNLRFIFIFLH